MRFENRFQAGQILAEKLKPWASSHPLVLALPRGGVPVAYEIAKTLRGQLDVLLVKKIGVPGHRELALGAIAEQSEPYWNNQVLALVDLSKAKLKSLSSEKLSELEEQNQKLRGDRQRIPIKDRVVILVDDGLATGSTMIAAIQCLRQQEPAKVIVAVPVGSKQAVETISRLVDEVVICHIPEELWSVGMWFQDFTQVSAEEVKELLFVEPGAWFGRLGRQ